MPVGTRITPELNDSRGPRSALALFINSFPFGGSLALVPVGRIDGSPYIARPVGEKIASAKRYDATVSLSKPLDHASRGEREARERLHGDFSESIIPLPENGASAKLLQLPPVEKRARRNYAVTLGCRFVVSYAPLRTASRSMHTTVAVACVRPSHSPSLFAVEISLLHATRFARVREYERFARRNGP